MSGFRTYDDWKCTPPPDGDYAESAEHAEREEEERREHLWSALPVRCWCGECHVIGIDNRDEDFGSADDENAPSLDDRLNNDDEPECPF